jgi:hypothetical protein
MRRTLNLGARWPPRISVRLTGRAPREASRHGGTLIYTRGAVSPSPTAARHGALQVRLATGVATRAQLGVAGRS